MTRVVVAAGPDFDEQEQTGRVRGAVKLVGQAAILLARGTDQTAQFLLEDSLLPVARAELHGQRDGVFGEPRRSGACARRLPWLL